MQSVKIYQRNQRWSSFSDVEVSVSIEEYLITEQMYIALALKMSMYLSIQEYQVVSLEDHANYSKYKEFDYVSLQDVDNVIQDVLREKYWCKLVSPDIQIHFGYDYCMYIVALTEGIDLLSFPYDDTMINVLNYTSPYL